jgi:hypothetical protein
MTKDKNKEIKVLKERVNKPFKEVGDENFSEKFPESKPDEENLEEEIEETETQSNNTPEIPTSTTTANAPILESTDQSQTSDNLEEEVEDVPVDGDSEGNVYNAPDYGENYELVEEREGDAETGEIIGIRETPENQVGEVNQRGFRQQIRENQEIEEGNKDYEIMDLRREEEEEGLPFERKKRRR